MSPAESKRYGAILIVTLLMGSLVMVIGSALYEPETTRGRGETGKDYRMTHPGPLRKQAGPTQTFGNSPWAQVALSGSRSLDDYYDLREYPGAPPIIPHKSQTRNDMQMGGTCNSCHRNGGYVKKMDAFAPVTPHPGYSYCQQCHVPRRTETRYKATEWRSVSPPDLGQSALPGAPPPIPHDLRMRTTCVACHAGPSAVGAIKTDHPNRSNCTQCHVAQKTDRTWKRNRDQ